jgi:hypothetical protein
MPPLEVNEQLDKALAQVATSGELALALPALEAILHGLEQGVRNRLFCQLNTGEEVDPQAALRAWVELHTYHKLRTRLTQATRMGQSAGKRLEQRMNENGE